MNRIQLTSRWHIPAIPTGDLAWAVSIVSFWTLCAYLGVKLANLFL